MQILKKVELVHEHCLALLQIAFEIAGGKAHFFRKHGLITTEGVEANEEWIRCLISDPTGTLRIIKTKSLSQQHNTELHNRVKQCYLPTYRPIQVRSWPHISFVANVPV